MRGSPSLFCQTGVTLHQSWRSRDVRNVGGTWCIMHCTLRTRLASGSSLIARKYERQVFWQVIWEKKEMVDTYALWDILLYCISKSHKVRTPNGCNSATAGIESEWSYLYNLQSSKKLQLIRIVHKVYLVKFYMVEAEILREGRLGTSHGDEPSVSS